MLPAFKTATFKSAALAALTAFAIAATPAAPAYAWGDNEQNFVKGIGATLLLQGLIREAKRGERNQPVYHEPVYQEPVYQEPQYHQPRHHPQPHYQTSIYRTPAAQAFNSYSKSERRLIQKRLSAFGYYRGGFDGAFGPGTYSAVAAYADDEGQSLASTGAAFGVYDGLMY